MNEISHDDTLAKTCPRWLKLALSVALLGHFLAIFFSVTGVSETSFSGPRICQAGLKACRPYLGRLLLDCPYRFYAPNPGVSPCLWLRVHFANGKSFCVEWPYFREPAPESRFVREMGLVESLKLALVSTNGSAPEVSLISPSSEALGSCAARLANVIVPAAFPHVDSKLLYLDFYRIHRVQPPPHVLRPDMDLFSAQYHAGYVLGRYDAQGNRMTPLATPELVIGELIQVILELDIQPHLEQAAESPVDLTVYARRWPTAIDQLLKKSPELKKLKGKDLTARLESLMSSP